MFPTKLYQNYLNAFKISSDEDLTYEKLRLIFLTTVNDFFSEKISLDEVSKISGKLFSFILDNPSMKGNDGTLLGPLQAGDELSFYLRKDKKLKQFKEYFSEVVSYYEANKHLLDS